MKRGVKAERDWQANGFEVLRLQKTRGKFTLEEIQDILLYEDNDVWHGRYVLILNCTETAMGGNLYWGEEPSGDTVELLRLEDSNGCPVCGSVLPPFEYCPHCGRSWNADVE